MKSINRRMLWIAFALLCLIAMFASMAAADAYYCGPENPPNDPVVVVTPRPTPRSIIEVLTPSPSPTPKKRPKQTPKPTPKPSEPPVVVPEVEPSPDPEPSAIYELTVYYRFSDGTEAAVPYERLYQEGESYEVHSPTINGYNVTRKTVSGIMEGRNLSFVVYYCKNGDIILDDYGTPLGLGDVIINIGDCYE